MFRWAIRLGMLWQVWASRRIGIVTFQPLRKCLEGSGSMRLISRWMPGCSTNSSFWPLHAGQCSMRMWWSQPHVVETSPPIFRIFGIFGIFSGNFANCFWVIRTRLGWTGGFAYWNHAELECCKRQWLPPDLPPFLSAPLCWQSAPLWQLSDLSELSIPHPDFLSWRLFVPWQKKESPSLATCWLEGMGNINVWHIFTVDFWENLCKFLDIQASKITYMGQPLNSVTIYGKPLNIHSTHPVLFMILQMLLKKSLFFYSSTSLNVLEDCKWNINLIANCICILNVNIFVSVSPGKTKKQLLRSPSKKQTRQETEGKISASKIHSKKQCQNMFL